MPSNAGSITVGIEFDPIQAARNAQRALTHIERGLKPLGQYSNSFNDFSKSIDAAATRVFSFGATAATFFTIKRAVVDLVKSTVEVEKAMTDVNVVLNLSASKLANFRKEIFQVAKDTGQSFKDVSGAAVELSRQGLGAVETQKRLKDAMVLTRLAGIDANSSVEALTATINSFSDSILDSTEIVSKFAKVDAMFAVSSRDFAEAVKRVGSTAQDAGVDIDQLIGLITSLQQSTARGGAIIGNSLKTILTRPQRSSVIEELEKIGVVVRDGSGNLLEMLKILDNVEKSFANLGTHDKSKITEMLGSLYQINQLKSLLKDLGRNDTSSVFGQATQASKGAGGQEALLRNIELNKTLAAQLNQLGLSAKQIFADIGDNAFGINVREAARVLNMILDTFIERDSLSIGVKLADGLLKGFSNAIFGPVGLGIGAVLLKVGLQIFKNLFTAFKSLSFGGPVGEEMQRSLSTQASLMGGINGLNSTRLTQEQAILATINAQNAAKSAVAAAILPNAISSSTVANPNRYGQLTRFTSNQIKGTPLRTAAEITSEGLIFPSNALRTSQELSALGATAKERSSAGSMISLGQFYNPLTGSFSANRSVGARSNMSPMLTSLLPGQISYPFGEKSFVGLGSRGTVGSSFQSPSGFQNAFIEQKTHEQALAINKLVDLGRRPIGGSAASAQLAAIGVDPTVIASTSMKRRNNVMNMGLASSFIGPMLGGVLGSFFDTSTRMGRVGSFTAEGIGGTAGLVGMGAAMSSNPIVPMIAGVVGAIWTLKNAFQQLNTVLPETVKAVDAAKDAYNRSVERGQQVAKAAEMVAGFKSGDIKPTEANLKGFEKIFRSATFGSGMEKDIYETIFSGNSEKINDIRKRISDEPLKLQKAKDLGLLFQGMIGKGGSGAGDVASLIGELANITDEDRLALGNVISTPKKSIDKSYIAGQGFSFPQNESFNLEPIAAILARSGANLSTDDLHELAVKDPASLKVLIEKLRSTKSSNSAVDRIKGLIPKGKKSRSEMNALILAESLSEGSIFRGGNENELSRRLSTEENELGLFRSANQITLANMALSSSPSAIEEKRGFLGREEAIRSGSLAVSGIRGSTGTGIMNLAASIKNISQGFGPDFAEFIKGAEVLERAGGGLALGDKDAGKDIYDTIGSMSNAIGSNVVRKTELGPILDQIFIILQKGLSQEVEKNEQTKALTDSLKASTENNIFLASSTGKAITAVNDYYNSLEDLIEKNERMATSGYLFSDEEAGVNIETKLARVRRGEDIGIGGAMLDTFSERFSYGTKDVYRDLIQGAAEVGDAMKNSFKDAFRTFLDGSQSAGAALRSLGLSFANKILDIAATGTTNLLFGGIQSLGSSLFGRGQKFGPGYATGGYVSGGSGMRDDVPAMLNEGDFVLRKSSVNKYGVGFLNALNFAGGGGVNFSPSSPLSNFALSDENNPQNQMRMEKEASDLNALLQYNAAKSAFDSAKKQRRIGALINLGVAGIGAGLGTAFSKGTNYAFANRSNSEIWGGQQSSIFHAAGGPIRGFAGGGSVDNVPALLTGGEFVMNRSAVSRHGVGFMHRLNRGEVPGFNNGGFVGETIEGGGSGRDSGFGDSISRLINSNEKLRASMEKGGNSQDPNVQTAPQLVGSISINVQIDNAGNAKADVQTEGGSSRENQAERGAQLGNLIKSTVLETINKESRNGGLLEQNFQRRR